MRATLAAFALVLALGACNTEPAAPPVDPAAEATAIRAAEESLIAAITADDVDAAVAVYAPDAVVHMPFEAPMATPEAIRTGLTTFVADPNAAWQITTGRTEVAASGDLAYTTADFVVTYTNPITRQPESSNGYSILVWKKQEDGAWKIVSDVNIAAMPAAPTPPTQR